MKELGDLDWESITDYIESGQAALLIGPELPRINGLSMEQGWRNGIWEKFNGKIAYHYEREGLFLFSSKIAKNDAARFVRKFAGEQAPDEAVFKKLPKSSSHSLYLPVLTPASPTLPINTESGTGSAILKTGASRWKMWKNRRRIYPCFTTSAAR